MVLAYHLIISAYGFWLPNDDRGSWSDFVRSYDLYLAGGPATKVTTRRSVAARPSDPDHRGANREALKYPPVRFDEAQRQVIAAGFATAMDEYNYTCHACAILPDHAHFVIARHTRTIEQVRDHLKSRATRALNEAGLNPMSRYPPKPSPWARKGWQVYLNEPADVVRTMRYVEENPIKAGLPRQEWPFVTAYHHLGADAPR